MIKPEELRIGNILKSHLTGEIVVTDWLVIKHVCDGNLQSVYDNRPVYEPIPLTEELLVKAGFEKVPHFTVTNSLLFNVGRNRIISIGCVGTPNEMVYLNEVSATDKTKITDLICLRNYDYDGKTYLHQIQNICRDFGTELTIKL